MILIRVGHMVYHVEKMHDRTRMSLLSTWMIIMQKNNNNKKAKKLDG